MVRRLRWCWATIFYGHALAELLGRAAAKPSGASVFAYQVNDPERYGVVEFDAEGRALSLRKTRPAQVSLCRHRPVFLYDEQVVDIAKSRFSLRRAASWKSPTSIACIWSKASWMSN